ncbi:MAG: hypothetical protein ACXVEF_12245 [Polyangiales bacterium]
MSTPRVPELLTIVVIASACGCGPEPEPAPQACTTRVLADGGVEHTGNCDAAVDTGEDLDAVV